MRDVDAGTPELAMDIIAAAPRTTRPVQFLRADPPPRAPTQAPGVAKRSEGPAAGDDGVSFLDVLSMLNPLQYLPVVGSIYRAVTGDTIPETVRTVGSMVVSGLLGGPVGVAINAASTALQKLVGFDPDEVARWVLAGIGLVDERAETAGTAAVDPRTEAGAARPPSRDQRAASRVPAEPEPSGIDTLRIDTAAAFATEEGHDAVRRQLAAVAYGASRFGAATLRERTLLDLSA